MKQQKIYARFFSIICVIITSALTLFAPWADLDGSFRHILHHLSGGCTFNSLCHLRNPSDFRTQGTPSMLLCLRS